MKIALSFFMKSFLLSEKIRLSPNENKEVFEKLKFKEKNCIGKVFFFSFHKKIIALFFFINEKFFSKVIKLGSNQMKMKEVFKKSKF